MCMYIHIRISRSVYIYIYIYACVCVDHLFTQTCLLADALHLGICLLLQPRVLELEPLRAQPVSNFFRNPSVGLNLDVQSCLRQFVTIEADRDPRF